MQFRKYLRLFEHICNLYITMNKNIQARKYKLQNIDEVCCYDIGLNSNLQDIAYRIWYHTLKENVLVQTSGFNSLKTCFWCTSTDKLTIQDIGVLIVLYSLWPVVPDYIFKFGLIRNEFNHMSWSFHTYIDSFSFRVLSSHGYRQGCGSGFF